VSVTFGTAVTFTPEVSTSVGRGVGTGVREASVGGRTVGAIVAVAFATGAAVFVGAAVRVGDGEGVRVGLGVGVGVGVGSAGRGAESPDSSFATGG